MIVEIRGGIAFVKATDAVRNLSTIYQKVLKDHERVVVLVNGRPVAEIHRPGDDVRYERRRF